MFWLFFWLHNDSHKIPNKFIVFTFIIGALTVPLVIPLENIAHNLIPIIDNGIIATATIEEILKFIIIAFLVLSSRHIKEPCDYVVYLVTGALGFAAFENILFLIGPLTDNNLVSTIVVGNIRFLGSTVLHSVSAAMLGISLGVAFYQHKVIRIIYALFGLFFAITLHALFNIFIKNGGVTNITITIAILWIVGIIVVSLFRRLGDLRPPMYNINVQ